MRYLFKKIWLFVFACVAIGENSLAGGQVMFYLLAKRTNVGEYNQVKGIERALEGFFSDFQKQEFDIDDKSAFLTAVKNDLRGKRGNYGVIIASGEETIPLIMSLKPRSNMVIVYSHHQLLSKHQELKDKVDIIALPAHAVSPEDVKRLSSRRAKVIATIGVPHNVTMKEVQSEYEQYKEQFPKAPHYIGVMLGGDAPTADKKMLYYTQEEARQLADYLAPHIRSGETHLFILNGPRTGKHDPQTGQVLEASHRTEVLDPVTQSFLERLVEQGVEESRFTVFDFQYGKPSLQKAVLGSLLRTKSPLYVAGESSSNISEAADILPGHVIAYMHGAMNTTHHKHLETEQACGRIKVLKNENGVWSFVAGAFPSTKPQSQMSAAETIADATYKLLAERMKK
jgi:hypothetical protein